MRAFMDKDFLLKTGTARTLYHDYAEKMPILDCHCHIDPVAIYEDKRYSTITEVWLGGDHYKWRAMRSCGVPERYITGDASPAEKFQKWAETMPSLIGNPLYHWTHLELQRYFGITQPLNGDNAVIGSIMGAFQTDSAVPGKLQQGSAWWFNDHKPGMEAQLTSLMTLGPSGPSTGCSPTPAAF